MTSDATKESTEAFLKANAYFGLNPDHVFIFEQAFIPCLTTNGKLILSSKSKLARAPDGNGGLYVHPPITHHFFLLTVVWV